MFKAQLYYEKNVIVFANKNPLEGHPINEIRKISITIMFICDIY